jgi:hypothetical protein
MGIFDKKRKSGDEFESPVEFIDLGAREETARAPAPAAAPVTQDAGPSSPEYGIDKAIALMRQLPQDNVPLIVQVVKATLESLHVQVPTILHDAAHKLQRLETRVATLKGEIADLQKEIETRRAEIGKHEADHEETSRVRDRLQLAEGKPRTEPAGDKASERKSSAPSGSSSPSAPASASASASTMVAGISGRPKG